MALTKLDNSGVAAGPVPYLFGDLSEEFAYCFVVLQVSEYLPAIMGSILFRPTYDRLDKFAQCLCFRLCCRDPFVLNQRVRKGGKRSLAMRCRPS